MYPVTVLANGPQLNFSSICSAADGNLWAPCPAPDNAYALKIALDGTYSVYPAPRFVTDALYLLAQIGCTGDTIFLAALVDDRGNHRSSRRF